MLCNIWYHSGLYKVPEWHREVKINCFRPKGVYSVLEKNIPHFEQWVSVYQAQESVHSGAGQLGPSQVNKHGVLYSGHRLCPCGGAQYRYVQVSKGCSSWTLLTALHHLSCSIPGARGNLFIRNSAYTFLPKFFHYPFPVTFTVPCFRLF